MWEWSCAGSLAEKRWRWELSESEASVSMLHGKEAVESCIGIVTIIRLNAFLLEASNLSMIGNFVSKCSSRAAVAGNAV